MLTNCRNVATMALQPTSRRREPPACDPRAENALPGVPGIGIGGLGTILHCVDSQAIHLPVGRIIFTLLNLKCKQDIGGIHNFLAHKGRFYRAWISKRLVVLQ